MEEIWDRERMDEFCEKYNVEAVYYKDTNKWYVTGNINIEDLELVSLADILPPIQYLNGDLVCAHNNLSDFIGAPDSISGTVDMSHNKFTSLKGCPILYNYNSTYANVFDVEYNNLVTLDGVNPKSNAIIICKNNPDLKFTKTYIKAISSAKVFYDESQLIPEDPSEFIEKGILPI